MFTNYKEKKYKNEIHIYSYLFLIYIQCYGPNRGLYIITMKRFNEINIFISHERLREMRFYREIILLKVHLWFLINYCGHRAHGIHARNP